jgi:hypothetical protein
MSNDIMATFDALSKLPELLSEVRTGVDTLKTLASAPAAAMATGSPAAGAAIVALGGGLAYLLADMVKAIDDDIDGMRNVQSNYRSNEDAISELAQLGLRLLGNTNKADQPSLATPGIAGPVGRGPSHS